MYMYTHVHVCVTYVHRYACNVYHVRRYACTCRYACVKSNEHLLYVHTYNILYVYDNVHIRIVPHSGSV